MTPLRELYDLYCYPNPAKEERRRQLLTEIPTDARDEENYGRTSLHIAAEFADCEGMEKACRRKGARTTVYYCHPYSSWERGSNERQNGMIRRKHPKGTDFATIPASTLKKTEEWINNYPRKIFNFHTAAEVFEACMNSL